MPLALASVPILLYLPAFYAKEVGISAGLVGLIFSVGRLWDGLADVPVGWLSDRTRSRFGRRKPWVVIGAPFLMAATWFLCNPPEGAGLVYLAVWAAIFYTADTICKIPHISWGTELATEYTERSRVTAYLGTFTMLGNLFFVSAPLVFLSDNAPLSAVLLLISFSTLLLTPLAVIPIGALVPDPPRAVRSETHLLKGLIPLAKDRVFVLFSAAILCYGLGNGVMNSLAVFSFGVGLQLPNELFWIIFILYVSTLCAVPLVNFLGKHLEKHSLLMGGLLLTAAVNGAHVFVPAGNFTIVAVLWVLAGVGTATWFVLPPSMLADIIDRGELTDRERRSGAYTAVYNLTMRIGMALGVGLAFGSLELVGFQPNAAEHSAADAFNVRLLGFGLPGVLFLIVTCLIWKHPITKTMQQRLRAEISARNSPA